MLGIPPNVIRVLAQRGRNGDPTKASREFRKARRAIALSIVAVAFWSVAASSWSNDLDASIAMTIGVLLVAIGGAGRIWVSSYQAGHKTLELITVGPYSLCRHPMYFCNLLGGMGVAIASDTFALPMLFVIVFFLHYRRVIAREETLLRSVHGAVRRLRASDAAPVAVVQPLRGAGRIPGSHAGIFDEDSIRVVSVDVARIGSRGCNASRARRVADPVARLLSGHDVRVLPGRTGVPLRR